MSSSPIASAGERSRNLGTSSSEPSMNNMPFDMNNLSPEAFDQIAKIIESANNLLTPAERERREIAEKKRHEAEQRLRNAIEKDAAKEVFTIPRSGGEDSKTYKFIGYSTDNFEEIMKIANEADNLPPEEKVTEKWLKLQSKVWKLTVKYSLEG